MLPLYAECHSLPVTCDICTDSLEYYIPVPPNEGDSNGRREIPTILQSGHHVVFIQTN